MNPAILLFARYFRFSSEQYPLSARTSFGFCPDCSWMVSISGTHLPFIVGPLRDRLTDDQLPSGLDRQLGVVALHESIRPFQDA